ncbi:Golgi-to-ER vesicle coat component [Arthrobotrys musiformis]|uniref:Coatomer subunit zeta n=1 Tax=Arthrobotrys musiformis TaxID=47236 RepID=A0AAV9W4Y9_9PEZI
MTANLSLFSINAILIIDQDGNRVLAKYYSAPHLTTPGEPGSNPYPTLKDQQNFEKGLHQKTFKQSSDIILYDNRIVVYKPESDITLYVIGSLSENPILLYNVVLALRDSLSILLKNTTDKRTIIENYDLVSLAIDEIVDDGIVLETDPSAVAARVSKPPAHELNPQKLDFSEQGLYNAWNIGSKIIANKLREGL